MYLMNNNKGDNMTNEEAKTIAGTILKQLGGNKFIAMTGAHSFSYDKNGTMVLKFKGSKTFNGLRISLNSIDTYDMTFIKIRNLKFSKKEISGVYNDQLQSIFEEETGLYTHL